MRNSVVVFGIGILVILGVAHASSRAQVSRREESKQPKIDVSTQVPAAGATKRTSGAHVAAAIDTFVLATFTFDDGVGGPDPQGWVSVDLSAQKDTFFHVDDFAGLPTYVPLEGAQSMWCGARLGHPSLPVFATPPGYGNNWDQYFESKSFATSGDVTLQYLIRADTEGLGFDDVFVEYLSETGFWRELAKFAVIGRSLEAHTIPADSLNGQAKFRFRFVSDHIVSDEDGLFNFDSDGAVVLDSISVTDASGLVDFQNFETETVGDLSTSDGDWMATVHPFGNFAELFDGTTVLQEDSLVTNSTYFWGFFSGSPDDYSCDGHPEQLAIPFGRAGALVRFDYLMNEVWSPLINLTQDVGGMAVPDSLRTILSFDVYRDLPLDNVVFYQFRVRSQVAGSFGPWRSNNFAFFSGEKDWHRHQEELISLIDTGATHIQVAVGVLDNCAAWCNVFGSGNCHSHAPLIDNVEIVRFVEDTLFVTTAFGLGAGSLRQAIITANSAPNSNVIAFDIPGPGPHTITLDDPLDVLTSPVVIDARTQPGYSATPLVVLDGSNEKTRRALIFQASDSGVMGLRIESFDLGGVGVTGAERVEVRSNEFSDNGGFGNLGIDLGNNGVTSNDVGDGDTGANGLQNFPVLTSADPLSSTIQGTLNSLPNGTYDIDFFSSGTCNPLGHGEGEAHLGSIAVVTDGNGDAQFTTVVPVPFLGASSVTATATDASGNTSEFSACLLADDPTVFAVTNTNDSGAGSLRQAILDANANAGFDQMAFNIPGGGPHTIQPLTLLPELKGPVLLDGYTQPGASPNTNGVGAGTNAVLMIEIDGSGLFPGFGVGVRMRGDARVRGIVVNRCSFAGVVMNGNDGAVEGCFLGTDATGTNALPNGSMGIGIGTFALRCTVGGVDPGDCNVISGNDTTGVIAAGDSARVVGNLIGTDATGTTALANLIGVAASGEGVVIGGALGGERNVISGNTTHGVISYLGDAAVDVVGNFIGLDVTGTAALGNGENGISLVTIGGTTQRYTVANNTIAHNGEDGIFIPFVGVSAVVSDNSLFANGDLGIFAPSSPAAAPVVTSVTSDVSSTTIDGTVVVSGLSGILEFYVNNVCDPSGFGEGKRFLGSCAVSATGGFSCTVATLAFPGGIVTAYLREVYVVGEELVSEFSACVNAVNTPVGSNVVVQPIDETTGSTPLTMTFDSVTIDGVTSLTTSGTGPVPPSGFDLCGTFYDVSTTATFSGNIELCIAYDEGSLPGPESGLVLFHYDEGLMPADWVDVTTSLDTLSNVICGQTTSLSPFVLGVPVTGTGITLEPIVPRSFALHQNWPNPFNPTTTISYDVPSGGGQVEIAIYDVSGRRVRRLVEKIQNAGRKTVTWDGRDSRGDAVATGVYFYRMAAGDFVVTRKMLLLK